jgi:hypothetical protein
MIQSSPKPIRMLMPRRRWTQFSLGTLFVGVTALCLWLAWCVERARRQRIAVAEFRKLHVAVMYSDPGAGRGGRRTAGWGERVLGAAYREPVDYIGFQHAHRLFNEPERVEKVLSLLVDIRGPKRLNLEGLPITDDHLIWLKPLVDLQKLNLMYTDVSDAGVAQLRQTLPNCQIVR